MNDKKIPFLPFHAINEFMLDGYRLQVIQQVLGSLQTLPEGVAKPLVKAVKKSVNVPGFRNSMAAPVGLKARGAVKTFEKDPGFVVLVLSGWAELHADLREKIYSLLVGRGWDILRLGADRGKLPGFLTTWLRDENFEVLIEAFREAHPDDSATEDDISLMTVWLGGRLPYEFVDALEGKEGDQEPGD